MHRRKQKVIQFKTYTLDLLEDIEFISSCVNDLGNHVKQLQDVLDVDSEEFLTSYLESREKVSEYEKAVSKIIEILELLNTNDNLKFYNSKEKNTNILKTEDNQNQLEVNVSREEIFINSVSSDSGKQSTKLLVTPEVDGGQQGSVVPEVPGSDSLVTCIDPAVDFTKLKENCPPTPAVEVKNDSPVTAVNSKKKIPMSSAALNNTLPVWPNATKVPAFFVPHPSLNPPSYTVSWRDSLKGVSLISPSYHQYIETSRINPQPFRQHRSNVKPFSQPLVMQPPLLSPQPPVVPQQYNYTQQPLVPSFPPPPLMHNIQNRTEDHPKTPIVQTPLPSKSPVSTVPPPLLTQHIQKVAEEHPKTPIVKTPLPSKSPVSTIPPPPLMQHIQKGAEEHSKTPLPSKSPVSTIPPLMTPLTLLQVPPKPVHELPLLKFDRRAGFCYTASFDNSVSPGHFYINLLVEATKTFPTMVEKINELYENKTTSVKSYQLRGINNLEKRNMAEKQLGKYAMYKSEGEPWARVMIDSFDLDQDQHDFVQVQFVDNGDWKLVSLSDLHSMHESLTIYPAFAQRCHLYNTHPVGSTKDDIKTQWPDMAVDMFLKLMTQYDEGILVDICEGADQTLDSLPVSLRFPHQGSSSWSVSEKLVELGCAVILKDPEPDQDLFCDLEPSSSHIYTISDSDLLCKFEDCPPIGATIDVILGYYPIVNNFFCIRRENEALLDELNEYFNKEETVTSMEPLTQPPKTNMLVMCQFSRDSRWYRALVTEVVDDEHVDVVYLDYGNNEVVPNTQLRQMQKSFLNYPCQIFECILNIMQSQVVSVEKVARYLARIANTETLTIKILEVVPGRDWPRVKVTLFNSEGVDIEQRLVQLNYADTLDFTDSE